MWIVVKLKRDDLRQVAEEIGLTVPRDAKMIDLKRLIEESDLFKEHYEFIKTVIEQVLKEIKTQKSKENIQIELELFKLERVKKREREREELGLAKFRSSAYNNEISLNGCVTETSIDGQIYCGDSRLYFFKRLCSDMSPVQCSSNFQYSRPNIQSSFSSWPPPYNNIVLNSIILHFDTKATKYLYTCQKKSAYKHIANMQE
ncbi:uncharacterized protein TNCV_2371831 [Trichonephila clavipes]|nr:uncharacterized protein TNCV_2371831 [Trichonephila clavipes]